MKKRGISNIVVTVLLVLLAIIAITIAWIVIKNLITDSSEKVTIYSELLKKRVTIIPPSYSDNGTDIYFRFTRKPGGDKPLSCVYFQLEDTEKNIYVTREFNSTFLDELQVFQIIIHKAQYGITRNITKISIFPCLIKDKKEYVSQAPSDVFDVPNNSPSQPLPPTPSCTNGATQSCGTDVGECTAGTETCSGGSWTGCTATLPSTEICNNLDDDCDSSTDEGLNCALKAICTNSLIAYWSMNESSGTALDLLGISPATTHNETRTLGIVGNAVNLSSITSSYLETQSPANNILNPGRAFTMSVWTQRLSDSPRYEVILEKTNGTGSDYSDNQDYWMQLDEYNRLDFGWVNETGGGYEGLDSNTTLGAINNHGPILELNTWYFLTVTYNGSVAKAYVNGTLVASAPASGIIRPSSRNIQIGRGYWSPAQGEGWSYRYKGYIDELGIWNRSLSQTEIQELYNGGSGTTCILS